jgi:uncharacterized protein
VTASYAGRARLTEVNEAAHVVRMDAEGRESGGAGSAKLRMTSRVDSHPDGGSEVRVEAEVDVAGKIVQFGRGMIESVSKQLFKEFAGCVRATLESAAPAAATADPARVARAEATGSAPTESRRAGVAPADRTRVAEPAAATRPTAPVAVLPLILRALWATVSGWVARIFGRRREA